MALESAPVSRMDTWGGVVQVEWLSWGCFGNWAETFAHGHLHRHGDLDMRRPITLLILSLLAAGVTPAVTASANEDHTVRTDAASYVSRTPRPGSFPLVSRGRAAPLVVSGG